MAKISNKDTVSELVDMIDQELTERYEGDTPATVRHQIALTIATDLEIFVLVRNDLDDGSITIPVASLQSTLAKAKKSASDNYEMLFEEKIKLNWKEDSCGNWVADAGTVEYTIAKRVIRQ